jgi:hypothetical protein
VSSQTDRVRRAVELCVFAPIGVAVWLRDLAPTFVNMFVARGRAEVERREEQVQQHIKTARGAGESAIAFGAPLRERLATAAGGHAPAARGGGEPDDDPPTTVAPPPVAASLEPIVAAAPSAAAATTPADRNGAATLAIPGYDALSASQVVERLAGLELDELAAVRDYEAAHRNRRTILGKLEQLASNGSSTPIETSSGPATSANAIDTSASA